MRIVLAAALAAMLATVLMSGVAVAADRDRDGMDDAWEQANGLRVGAKDAGGDRDRDELSNGAEFRHRSDPRDPLDPGRHLMLGALVDSRKARDGGAAIRRFERSIGRRIAVHRSFGGWNAPVATRVLEEDREAGRLPFRGWKAQGPKGGLVSWARIARGGYDAYIRRQALALKRFDAPVLLGFHHEPENDTGRRLAGSPADYRGAWRRIVEIFRAQDADNVDFAFVLMSGSYGHRELADRYYPGDRYVDYVGSNFFNAYPDKRGADNRSFKRGLAPFYRWGSRTGKPLVIGAFGAQEAPGNRRHRARWLREAERALKGWPRIRLACYFNSDERFGYALDGPGLRAFRDIARQVYFRATEL